MRTSVTIPRPAQCCIAALFLVALSGTTVHAQVMNCSTQNGTRHCVVEEGFGTLNMAVRDDTTATGERVDPNTWYVLKRGGTYLLNGSVENQGYHLRIMGERGEGHPPIVMPGVSETGSSDLAFSVRGDLTVRGFYLSHIDDAGGLQSRTFRVRTDQARVVVDSMFVDADGQSVFRTDGEGVRIFLTNSHLRNQVTLSSPDNGRIVDTRGNSPDTLWMENNTMYHFSQDIIRGAGAILPFVYFNHNTVYNGGEELDLERVVKAVITNNLLVNAPTDFTDDDPEEGMDRLDPFIRIDSLNAETLTEAERSIRIAHNNYYFTDEWTAFYESIDSIFARPMLNEKGQFLADNNPNIVVEDNFSSAVTFVDAPASDTYIEFRRMRLTDPANENPLDFRADKNGIFDGLDFSKVGIGDLPYDFDFSYPATELSYTAAEDGFPVGDLNWFPARKAAWVATDTDVQAELPSRLHLHGNYPNPFNPSTAIVFDLARAAEVSVAVYDLLGRRVMTLPSQVMTAGTGLSLRLDAGSLASGTYLYRLTAQSAGREDVATGRLVLVK